MAEAAPVPANVAKVRAPGAWMADPSQFAVNVPGTYEAISQPLYHYQAYPAAGTANPLTFFAVPQTGTVTMEDSNMQLGGQLPAGQKFLIQGVSIDYLPGTAATRFGAQSANGHVTDFWTVMRRGVLQLSIGQKIYLTMSTGLSMPMRSGIWAAGAASDQTTAAAAMQTFMSVARAQGDVYKPRPMLIESGQAFQAQIQYPGGAVAIPSADAAARIGIWLWGTLYRPAQ